MIEVLDVGSTADLGTGPDCSALLWELSAGFPESFAKLAGLPVWEPGAKGERSIMRPDLRDRLDACLIAKGSGKLAQWAAQQTPAQRAADAAYVRAVVDQHVADRVAAGADPAALTAIVHALDADPSLVYSQAQSVLDAQASASLWAQIRRFAAVAAGVGAVFLIGSWLLRR